MRTTKQLLLTLLCLLSFASSAMASSNSDEMKNLLNASMKRLPATANKHVGYIEFTYPFYFNNAEDDAALEVSLYYKVEGSTTEVKIGSVRPFDIYKGSDPITNTENGSKSGYQNGFLVFPGIIGADIGKGSGPDGQKTELTARWYQPNTLRGKNITFITRVYWCCNFNDKGTDKYYDFDEQCDFKINGFDGIPNNVTLQLEKTKCDELTATLGSNLQNESDINTNIETGTFSFTGYSIEDASFAHTKKLSKTDNKVKLAIIESKQKYPDALTWSYTYTPPVAPSDVETIKSNKDIKKAISSVTSNPCEFNKEARIGNVTAGMNACNGELSITAYSYNNHVFLDDSDIVFEVYKLGEGQIKPEEGSSAYKTITIRATQAGSTSCQTSIPGMSIDNRYYIKSYIDYWSFKEDCITASCIVESPTLGSLISMNKVELSDDLTSVEVSWIKTNCNNVNYTLHRAELVGGVRQTPIELVSNVENSDKFLDKTIVPCTSYEYWITATLPEVSARTLASEPLSIEIPEFKLLKNLAVERGQSQSGVKISFSLPVKEKVKYVAISRKIQGSKEANLTIDTICRLQPNSLTTEMSWVDEGAELGVIYNYSVTVSSGTCKPETLNGIGFIDASATINGNVAYRSASTASPLVDIEAVVSGGNCKFSKSRSMVLTGSNVGIIKMSNPVRKSISYKTDFTWQAWLRTGNNEYINDQGASINRTIFEYNGIAVYMNNAKEMFFAIGDNPYNTENKISTDTKGGGDFTHVTFSRSANTLSLYLNGELKDSLEIATSGQGTGVALNDTTASMGARLVLKEISEKETGAEQPYKTFVEIEAGSAFVGNIDEMRLWAVALPQILVKDNYNAILNGEEPELLGYWKFDEGVNIFCDRSRQSYKGLNGSDGVILGEYVDRGSEMVPSGLKFRTRTDKYGNYSLSGLPFEAGGTSYNIVPKKGGHEFLPINQNLSIDKYNAVVNNINFTDRSSFQVKVKVLYDGTNFPVENATFRINGITVTSEEKILTTNNEGVAILSVPYGKQNIRVEKEGHTFVDSIISVMVEEDITTPTLFYDKTKVKVAGRVVGGTRESSKEIGFGLSENNIGAKYIALTYDQSSHPGSTLLPEQTEEKTEVITHKYIISSHHTNIFDDNNKEKVDTIFGTNTTTIITTVNNGYSSVKIIPDSKTGEYECYLIPEIFKVSQVEFYNGSLTAFKNVSNWNLQGAHMPIAVSNQYKTTKGSTKEPETNTSGTQWYEYNYRGDFIYRSLPKMEIEQEKNRMKSNFPLYGVKELELANGVKAQMHIETLSEIESDGDTIYKYSYAPQFPVFVQDESVKFKISGYELYTKKVNDKVINDKVPLSDISVMISNGFTDKTLKDSIGSIIKFDPEKHDVTYNFKIGAPSGNEDTFAPEKSYTSVITAQYFFNQYPNVLYEVNTPDISRHKDDRNGQIRGYHLGLAKSKTNNFVTTGPDKVLAILRDPPGSNSSTTLQKGSVISKSLAKHKIHNYSAEGLLQLGVHVETGGLLNVANIDLDAMGSFSFTYESKKDSLMQVVETITASENISTSSSPDFIGTKGDVYVGLASNINYSNTDNINFWQVTSKPSDPSYPQFTDKGSFYAISPKNVPVLKKEYKTQFLYSQSHIVDYLLPTLQKQKSGALVYTPMEHNKIMEWQPKASDFPKNVNVMFLTNLKSDDPKWGTNNSDATWSSKWGTCSDWAVNAETEGTNGPSYYVKYMPNDTIQIAENQIYNYNSYISGWQNTIKANEENKIKSQQKSTTKNLSFDSGVSYTYGEEIVSDTIHGYTWEYMVMALAGGTTGGNAGAFAYNFDIIGGGDGLGDKYYDDWNNESSTTRSNTQSYSYTLQEEVKGNYFSVDVTKPISMNGTCCSPIFSVRAGQSKCPYQGEDLTLFYKEENTGKPSILNYATARIEKPVIEVNGSKSAMFSNIPSGEKCFFTLNLQNDGEADMMSTFGLKYVDKSNPNSAYIYVDDFLIEGQTFDLESKKGIGKIFSIQQSRLDVTEYDSIGLVFHSMCEMNPGIPGLSSLADTVWVSCHFQPAAPVVTMEASKAILNASSGLDIPITLSKLDANYKNFTGILLEYRAASSQEWTPIEYIVKREFSKLDTIPNITNSILENNLSWEIDNTKITSTIDFKSLGLADGVYYIRATSYLKQFGNHAATVIAQRMTDPIQIIKDTELPAIIGHQPQSGILLPDGEISLSFNEMINKGLISTENSFTLKGILNGSQQTHTSGLLMDGVSDYAETELSTSLNWRDRTIELWVYPLVAQEQVLLSHGGEAEFMELKLTETGSLVLTMNKVKDGKSKEYVFDKLKLDTKRWSHIAIRFQESIPVLSILCCSNNITGEISYTQDSPLLYREVAPLRLGKTSGPNSTKPFKGRIRDVRIWNRYLSNNEINNNRNSILTEQAEGLINYWLMDEAFGKIAQDKVGWQNIAVHSDWFVAPAGKSADFSGSTYLALDSYAHEITKEKDFSVDFWIKAEAGKNTGTAALFAVGDPNDSEKEGQAGIFIENGETIALLTDGYNLTLSNNAASLLDNNWHHLALSVERNGYLQFFQDGALVKSTPSTTIGGLTGGILTLGAVENKTGATNRFIGSFDGFRLWDKTLNSMEVAKWMHKKSLISESSILYYFPFENRIAGVGQAETTPTLQTQAGILNSKYEYEARKETLKTRPTEGTTEWYSDIAAPIKDETMVEDVLFKIIKNDQKLYLDISANSLEKIEGASLDLLLKKNQVRDLNGNSVASSYNFDILVNLKTLKFKDAKKIHNMRVGQNAVISIEIENLSGKKDYWQLNNLPWWLHVSKSSGSLDPYSSTTIVATIDPFLPIGLYYEKLSLRGNQRINHSLPIVVKVQGPDPMWSVNPADYDNSMGIVANVYIEELLSWDPEDMLAAFDQGTCVGVANIDPKTGLVFLNVYNKENKDKVDTESGPIPLTFKVYDASEGIIYTPITIKGSKGIKFESGKIIGSPDNPKIFTTTLNQEQQIGLHKGWNWISTYVDSDITADKTFTNQGLYTITLLKPQLGQMVQLWTDELTGISGYTASSFNIKTPDMYKASVTSTSLLKVAGSRNDLTSVEIPGGYKWFGFWKESPMSISEAMSKIKPNNQDAVIAQNGFSIYDATLGWVGTLTGLEPGKGYIYKNTGTEPMTLTYPELRAKSAVAIEGINRASNATHWSVNPYKYLNSMSVTAVVVNTEEIKEGNYELGAFVAGECRGAVKLIKEQRLDKLIAYLSIYGDGEVEDVSFKLYKEDENTEYDLDETIRFGNDKIVGSPNAPLVFHITSAAISDLSADEVSVYPIPMKDKLHVKSAHHITNMRIIDMQGHEIWRDDVATKHVIDVSALAPGGYIIVISTDSGTLRKVLLKE